jgi:hypothetical protein
MRRRQTHLSTAVAQQARVVSSKKTTTRLNEMHVMEQGNSDIQYIPHILWEDTDQPGLLAVRYLGKYVDINTVHRDQISGTCSTHGNSTKLFFIEDIEYLDNPFRFIYLLISFIYYINLIKVTNYLTCYLFIDLVY